MTKRLLLIATALLVSGMNAGCDRGDGGKSAGGGASASTQPGGAPEIPQVGKPHATDEQYKPVVGAYGGRLVRGHISEPKSFNPIVSSETSTSDYTMRMFEGLTRMNMFTGEVKPGLAESWSVSED